MSKAILVINMPDECRKCPCFQSNDFGVFCGVTDKEIKYDYDKFIYTKPIWCPLKDAPKEKDWSEVPYYVTDCYSYMQGWNHCLDKILSKY
jgi:hypothetical protein